jgi:large subunit ribosomal protein L18
MARLRTIKRRRRECKTDYKARRILLGSGIPRIVVRRSNNYFILQLVESEESRDKVLVTFTSKELLKNGWDSKFTGSLKSIPAGYLTGLLMAKKLSARNSVLSKKGTSKEVLASSSKGKYIMDLGMIRTIKGSRVFSVVKGLIDGGLDISANEIVFPSEERLNGGHLKEDVKKMIEKVKGGLL